MHDNFNRARFTVRPGRIAGATIVTISSAIVWRKLAIVEPGMISGTDHQNLVCEQRNDGTQCDPRGQSITAEKVQDHACPAETGSYQSADDIWCSGRHGEFRTIGMPQTKELTQCPDDD
jgi:hypothetical protein